MDPVVLRSRSSTSAVGGGSSSNRHSIGHSLSSLFSNLKFSSSKSNLNNGHSACLPRSNGHYPTVLDPAESRHFQMDESTLVVFGPLGDTRSAGPSSVSSSSVTATRLLSHSKSTGNFRPSQTGGAYSVTPPSPGNEPAETTPEIQPNGKRKTSRFSKLKRSKTISALKFFGFSSGKEKGQPTAADTSIKLNRSKASIKSNPDVPRKKDEESMVLMTKSKSTSFARGPTVRTIGSDGESEELGSDEVFLRVTALQQNRNTSTLQIKAPETTNSASSSLSTLLFASRLRKSQSVYEASSSSGANSSSSYSKKLSSSNNTTTGSEFRHDDPSTLVKERHHRSMVGLRRNPSTSNTASVASGVPSGGAKSVIRRRQSSQHALQKNASNGTSTSDAIDLISKRLSLPADLNLPPSFIKKIISDQQTKQATGGHGLRNLQTPNGDRDCLFSPLLDESNGPLTRKLRRQSLVRS